MSATEKDLFLRAYEREFNTTVRVLNAYPADKANLTGDTLRSARDIAFVFVSEQAVADMAMKGAIDFSGGQATPVSIGEINSMFQLMFRKNVESIRRLTEAQYNSSVVFPAGPGGGTKMRTADVLWMTLYDMVHHRGQLSVYLRLAGGKVPSIYGPSADETEKVFLV